MQQTLDQRKVQQTQELYALIGEFVVKFEMLCQHMRLAVTMHCTDASMASKNNINTLLAEMAAQSLLSSFRSIMVNQPNQTELGKSLFRTLHNQIKVLIEQRNEIVHGTHYIGWSNEYADDWSAGERVRMKLTNDGLDFRNTVVNEETMRPLIRDCEVLAEHVLGLASILLPAPPGFQLTFEKSYQVVGKRVVRMTPDAECQ